MRKERERENLKQKLEGERNERKGIREGEKENERDEESSDQDLVSATRFHRRQFWTSSTMKIERLRRYFWTSTTLVSSVVPLSDSVRDWDSIGVVSCSEWSSRTAQPWLWRPRCPLPHVLLPSTASFLSSATNSSIKCAVLSFSSILFPRFLRWSGTSNSSPVLSVWGSGYAIVNSFVLFDGDELRSKNLL